MTFLVVAATPTLSTFPPDRWSTVLVNAPPKYWVHFHLGVTPPLDGVTRGGPPPSDATWNRTHKHAFLLLYLVLDIQT